MKARQYRNVRILPTSSQSGPAGVVRSLRSVVTYSGSRKKETVSQIWVTMKRHMIM